MKKLEGKEVYLIPTGNNARGNKGNFFKAKVIKVARVFATIIINGRHYEDKLRIDVNGKMNLHDGHNGGYEVYETEQDLLDAKEIRMLANKIHHEYSYSQKYCRLDIETIRKVALLLGIDRGEE